jgi:hypothetical protein
MHLRTPWACCERWITFFWSFPCGDRGPLASQGGLPFVFVLLFGAKER